MDKKLTLSLNQRVIEKAKKYAKQHGTSLSRMIEAYFESLTSQKKDASDMETTPLVLVESLSGVIQLPTDYDYKKARTKYLNEKYK